MSMICNCFQMVNCFDLLFGLMIFLFFFLKCIYDIKVALMNIHEITCQISNRFISRTNQNNLMRFSAITYRQKCQLYFHRIKAFIYDL